MAIKINQSSTRVDSPSITLVGDTIVSGTYNGSDTTSITTKQVVIESSTAVRKREPITFWGDVVVTLTPDTTWTANTYTNRSSTDIVGPTASSIGKIAQKSETYYTLNGKDPIRTKANLYTGAFTLRSNKSGTDNTIIKARTYQGGRVSEVMTVEVRIVLNGKIIH